MCGVPDGTIFPRAALSGIDWANHICELTPVEERGGRLYKREDYFAPLGYGGINGAKLRQLVWLTDRARAHGAVGVLTGASVLSPQVSMAALVARHYDLPCTIVLGATTPDTSMRHENVRIAALAGADFVFNPVGFNPALQRAVRSLHLSRPDWYRLPYGISTEDEAADADVAAFHTVGSHQAANVPLEARTVVMTAGSCNSCVSVLYGLSLNPNNVERVVLLGVGPTRLAWIEKRLAQIAPSLPARYRRLYHHHPDLEHEHQTDGRVLLEHYDLHSTGFATYQDRMPFTADGIELHPTYEGKALTYMQQRPGLFDWFWDADGDVLFWIVGSAPSLRAMQDAFVLDPALA